MSFFVSHFPIQLFIFNCPFLFNFSSLFYRNVASSIVHRKRVMKLRIPDSGRRKWCISLPTNIDTTTVLVQYFFFS